MWKWLRSWFAWRFSLRRLVVAVVFLGAILGLNIRKIDPRLANYWIQESCWGWPFPFIDGSDIASHISADMAAIDARERTGIYRPPPSPTILLEHCQLPWTHQTYCLLELGPLSKLLSGNSDNVILRGIVCGGVNFLVAFIPLALILFLQIPRRKVAAKGG